jgi:predicted kinase
MELVVLVGLPASGKSTFCRERLADTHVVVSKDLMPRMKDRDARQRQLIAQALADGRSVVVDNTSPRRADRAPLVELGRAAGAVLVCCFFSSRVTECLVRNRQREGRARVPEVAIFTAAKRLERPSRAEGFDALYQVLLLRPSGFEVTEFRDEAPPPP